MPTFLRNWLERYPIRTRVDMYGAYMFQDITPDEARWYKENGKKADKNWLLNMIATLFGI